MRVLRREVVIAGSGFAGSILARMLLRRGREVLLLERDHHPRFALGESATPLAALALERIAASYGLDDLHDLAAYGRWSRRFPGLGRGLKRGFTFYRHEPGRPFANGPDNEARLLVAASPRDPVADAHWLRADLDHHLARRAVEEGAELWTGAEACGVSFERGGVEVDGLHDGVPFRVLAETVVDATGAGSFLARCIPLASVVDQMELDSCLVGGHFRGVRPLSEVSEADFEGAPYPEERAAIHHLCDEGWMYVLPFDHGVVSAGWVLDNQHPDAASWKTGTPGEVFRSLLDRYPSLQRVFAGAEPVTPILRAPRLQRRLARAAGPRWLMLPHAFAFADPIFATGIAWSLLGVERAAELLTEASPPDRRSLRRYEAQLQSEADQIHRLLAGALRCRSNFRLFTAWSFLYFTLVTWSETRQRLDLDDEQGFLGAAHEPHRWLLVQARDRLEGALAQGDEVAVRGFEQWIAQQIAPMDLVGLADPSRRNLYPVDLEVLVERAPLLGMQSEEMREALPRILRD